MPPPQIRDAMHVHIDANALGDAPGGGEGQIGHLGADAGEREEGGQAGGDVGAVLALEHGRGQEEVAGFGVVEADFGD